jgi:subfamily B ATP-binding cassette protein MsbA
MARTGPQPPVPPPGRPEPMTDRPADTPARPSRLLIGRLWRDYLRPYRYRMALAAALMTIEGSTVAGLARALEPLFDRVFIGRDAGAVWWVGGLILGLFLLRGILGVINSAIVSAISLRSSAALQSDLVRHLLTLDLAFFNANPPGALIERVQGDTQAVQSVWQGLVLGLGRDVVAVVALFAVALAIDPIWTLAALVGTPALIAPTAAVQRYIRRKTARVRAESGERATRLDEIFHGIQTVRLNGMEAYQARRFGDVVGRIARGQLRMAVGTASLPSLVDAVTGIGFFAVLMLGAGEIISGERSVGEFMSFFTALALAFQPLRRIGAIAGTWQTAAASLERIFALFDLKPSILRDPAARAAVAEAAPDIRFEDVRLAYAQKDVLSGLSFTAPAGRRTALVGASGAGKTTVFHLLTRLVDPTAGRILIGGAEISGMDPAALRTRFAVVTQDAWLFDETIRENIVIGRTDVSDAQLERALEAANAAEFVARLPLGLDTPVGPRGAKLSGGQRQRIAIARALVRDAPILLLDEATSALDPASEAAVGEALNRLATGRTTIVIAHRLATVRDADRIVVLSGGRAVETGRHDELIASGGTYAELFRLQFEGKDGTKE